MQTDYQTTISDSCRLTVYHTGLAITKRYRTHKLVIGLPLVLYYILCPFANCTYAIAVAQAEDSKFNQAKGSLAICRIGLDRSRRLISVWESGGLEHLQ